jgi:phosphoribosylaminoimidazolecarboxamide formyltransferase/IMP cyclohydrolase
MQKKKIIVFGSGSGSNFEAIAERIRSEKLPIEIAYIFSDNSKAFILERAKRLGIQSYLIDYSTQKDKTQFNKKILSFLQSVEPWDLVVLAGYMRILPTQVVRAYPNKIINIHPSVLPAFPGLASIEKALKAKVKLTGVTVHYVDEGIDTGPIIAQTPVEIAENETLQTLEEKIHSAEHQLYIKCIKSILLGQKETDSARPRALISVSDKTGIAEFASGLVSLGWEIFSTGGTAKFLQAHAIPVTPVERVTDFPEILGGRVKTLHPRIFSGILARRSDALHRQQLTDEAIASIDLVAVNFYPFREAAKQSNLTESELIEEIDIGGPSLVRAAAKNFEDVTVVVEPTDYLQILEELKAPEKIQIEMRRRLALKAFERVAELDIEIYQTLAKRFGLEASTFFTAHRQVHALRYGENPHQRAWLLENIFEAGFSSNVKVVWGKKLSYNNWLDVDSVLGLLAELKSPAAVIVKHNNPCGVARGQTLNEAFEKALASDPISAFGGIVGLNETVDEKLAETLNEIFLEIIIAPAFTPEAEKILQKKKDRRLLRLRRLTRPALELRFLSGDLLAQECDALIYDEHSWRVLDNESISDKERSDLLFAFAVAKHVKSNAIVVAKDEATLGIGAGQMNRVASVKLALEAAGQKARGAVLASDGFFPYADSVQLAAQFGIKSIIQPGGSVRDEEVFEAARRQQIKMVLTGVRHFKH